MVAREVFEPSSKDFQSFALPYKLSGHGWDTWIRTRGMPESNSGALPGLATSQCIFNPTRSANRFLRNVQKHWGN